MNNKEQEILENNKKFLKKVFKSLLYTFFVFMFSMFGIYTIATLVFNNMSARQADIWPIVSICIGIIFTIFFCTFTILDEIKKEK